MCLQPGSTVSRGRGRERLGREQFERKVLEGRANRIERGAVVDRECVRVGRKRVDQGAIDHTGELLEPVCGLSRTTEAGEVVERNRFVRRLVPGGGEPCRGAELLGCSGHLPACDERPRPRSCGVDREDAVQGGARGGGPALAFHGRVGVARECERHGEVRRHGACEPTVLSAHQHGALLQRARLRRDGALGAARRRHAVKHQAVRG